MLNASVGIQRVLGRVRRPSDPRAPSVQTRSFSPVRRAKRGLHAVIAASRLVPAHDPRVRADLTDHGARAARSVADQPPRAGPSGRHRGRSHPARRVGRERFGRPSGSVRPAAPTATGRPRGSRSAAEPMMRRTTRRGRAASNSASQSPSPQPRRRPASQPSTSSIPASASPHRPTSRGRSSMTGR